MERRDKRWIGFWKMVGAVPVKTDGVLTKKIITTTVIERIDSPKSRIRDFWKFIGAIPQRTI